MEYLSNDHEDRLNQHENGQKLCDEMGHPVLSLTESQWKLRQQHDFYHNPGTLETAAVTHFQTRHDTKTTKVILSADGEAS